ncbi:acyl-CoA dehydrogenase family protein [Sandaracinobacteroides saxicola]|uniref:Acyl-CoA dehydrogenase family protein n=1 Tax=Sandaracinobacteroides saxicola TaxID=2759707 RepID=A0A7G5IEY8_9SPHN|nr:acyl-CoA dehydrogenase [Sandaracinobacteroides saxicola]QMW21930.1 acyl-CoA dehydrogenase family protein [Sandaracinobacteroides saxicola]
MNFDWSEEQALLRASVERFGAERYGGDLEKRRRYRRDASGFDRAGWAALAGLGVTALPFAEADGGLGGGAVETIAIAEPLGAAMAVEPVTESLIAGGALLVAAASDGQRAEYLPGVITGETLLACAVAETAGRYNLRHVETRARRTGDGWVLNGAKTAVWQGMAADVLLVSARLTGETRSDAGIGIFAVPAGAVERRGWRAADGQVAAEVTLRELLLPADAHLDGAEGSAALDAMVTAGWIAASAEMLGIAAMLLTTTVDYVKQRVQFGKPLSAFQVIQHRLTDCYVAVEQARSMVMRAALANDLRAAAGAKAFVGEAARLVAHEAVQFHGGMGMTEELVVGHGLKRIQLLSRLFGDPESAAQLYARAA